MELQKQTAAVFETIQAKVEEARHALWDATEQNTGVLRSTVHLTDQKKELRSKLSSRQKNMVTATSWTLVSRAA